MEHSSSCTTVSLAPELWSGAVGRCLTQNQLSLSAQYPVSPEPLQWILYGHQLWLKLPSGPQTQAGTKKSNCSAVQNMQYEEGWLGSALVLCKLHLCPVTQFVFEVIAETSRYPQITK